MTLPLTPRPPAITTAPVVRLVDGVEEVNNKSPDTATLPLTSSVEIGVIFPIPTNPPIVFIPRELLLYSSAELMYAASIALSYPIIIEELLEFGTIS